MENKITPKDFFLHIAATIVLYVSTGALINLAFKVINYYFRDELAGNFYAESLNGNISTLVILVPTLYILSMVIHKDLIANPAKKDIWIRRWRIYLTLFLTGAMIIGDLIYLINTFLSGEITTRFIFKVIFILVVSAMIFVYYLLERSGSESNSKQEALKWTGGVIALATIALAFTTTGSPWHQRAARFDSSRISNLSSIQYQIISFWQRKGSVPTALSDLNDPISGYIVPTDPNTQVEYQYKVKNPTTFELCAVFQTKSQDNKGRGEFGGGGYTTSVAYPGYQENEIWNHDVGQTCFERKIDPTLYPVNPKTPSYYPI